MTKHSHILNDMPPHWQFYAHVHELCRSPRPSDWQFARLHIGADCYSLQELAAFLSVTVEELEAAREAGKIPAGWLLHLFHTQRINPHWVLDLELPIHFRDSE